MRCTWEADGLPEFGDGAGDYSGALAGWGVPTVYGWIDEGCRDVEVIGEMGERGVKIY
jgi:hypothetical protein